MNLGLVGALGGLGKGMADVAMDDLEEAKLTRLEELRTKNNRETNKMDSEQRHGYAVEEAGLEHGYRKDEQAQSDAKDLEKLKIGHDYSLAQLAQQNADQTGRLEKEYSLKNSALTEDQKNMKFLEQEGGVSVGDQYTDSQYGSNVRQPDKKVLADELRTMGASEEEIKNFLIGNKTPEQIRQEMIKASMSGGTDAQTAASEVDAMLGKSSAKPSGTTPTEGRTATNPKTGERMIYKSGQWVPM